MDLLHVSTKRYTGGVRRFFEPRERNGHANFAEAALIRMILAGLLIFPAAVAIGIIVSGNYWGTE